MMENSSRADGDGLITIEDGLAVVEIAPDVGGAVASYRWRTGSGAIDWLRPAEPAALASRDAGAMGCFPLVPYSNRIRDGRFTFANRPVTLPITPEDPHHEHGHGWRRPWTVDEHDGASTVLTYRHAPDSWPWSYEARQRLSLANGQLAIRLSIRNLAETPMPAGIGLHPYFPSTPLAWIEARVTGMWEADAEILPVRHRAPPGGANPTAGIAVSSTALDTVFTGWSRSARIIWPEFGRRLDIEVETPLDRLVLYTPPGEDYFCAEPVSNMTDAFNHLADPRVDTGCIVLQPGEACGATVRFAPNMTAP